MENKHQLIYGNMRPYPSQTELQNIFAAGCVESCAKTVGCSSSAMYQRMEKVNLFYDFIYPFYDTLHTESRANVTSLVLNKLQSLETANE